MLLGSAALWQVEVSVLYEHYAVAAGHIPLSKEFVERDTVLFRCLFAFNILCYTSICLIKLSFLLFFRRLGSRTNSQKVWWWCVLIINALAYITYIANNDYRCNFSSFDFMSGKAMTS